MPLVSKTFADIITFTRASTGTYFDSAGLLTSATTNTPRLDYNPATLAAQGLLIEEQRVNLLTYSSDFNDAVWTKANVIVSANIATSPDGNVNAELFIPNTTNADHSTSQLAIATAISGSPYSLSVFAKAGGYNFVRLSFGGPAGGGFTFFNLATGVIGTSSGQLSSGITAVGNGWYRCTITRNAGSAAALNGDIYVTSADNQFSWSGDGTSGIYLYGAQLEAGAFATSYAPSVNTFTSRSTTGTFFDSAGVLQSAAINVARNTYNPANLAAQPYLLLEEARTNSIRNNTMVGAVAGTPGTLPTNWSVFTSLTGLTRTLAVGTENGVSYIDVRLNGTPSAAGDYQLYAESLTQVVAASGQSWDSSFYYKLQAGSLAGISSLQAGVIERDAAGTFLAGTFTNIATPSATLVRGDTARTLSNASTARVSGDIRIVMTGAAIDITLRIGLPQLEQGAYATSVIPTTTTALTRAADISSSAQATRAADVASVNTLSPWYNASEGTLYAEVGSAPVNNLAQLAYELNDNLGGGLGRVFTRRTNAGTIGTAVANGGVTQVDLSSGVTIAVSAVYKVASAFATNNFAVSLNGAAASTATTGTMPSTIAKLFLGQNYGNFQQVNGYLRRITYYPRRLSDAELQSLTA